MKIRIKYHDPELIPVEPIANGDWLDLRAADDIFIPYREHAMVSLGVSMELPEGYEAHVAPRSSTFKTWGIIETNGFGIIDNSYCGDDDIWKMPVYCLEWRDTKDGKLGTYIRKNDRIAQFRIVKKQPEIEFETVKMLGNESRGGFGSTGKN